MQSYAVEKVCSWQSMQSGQYGTQFTRGHYDSRRRGGIGLGGGIAGGTSFGYRKGCS